MLLQENNLAGRPECGRVEAARRNVLRRSPGQSAEVTEAEVARAKSQLKASLVMNLESASARGPSGRGGPM